MRARRRRLLQACVLALAPAVPVRAQRVRVVTIGFLGAAEDPLAWLSPLRDLGWSEGRNLSLVRRPVDDPGALAGYAHEFVARGVDVIVTDGTSAARAAKAATTRIPIVMAAVGDPVDTGLVASFAHPGGNLTGYAILATETAAKRAQLVAELVPAAKDVAVVMDANNGMYALLRKRADEAYRALGIEPRFVTAQTVAELAAKIADPALRMHALEVGVDVGSAEAVIVMRAADMRGVPVIAASRPLLEAGALLEFDVDRRDHSRRVAAIIDKVLRGTPPASIAIEQPSSFVLVVNQKAAAKAGITVPAALLLRADEVLR